MGKEWKHSERFARPFRASFVGLLLLLIAVRTVGQEPTEAPRHELTEIDESYLRAGGTVIRCGKYFLLETKTYGELEVKQVHFTYAIPSGGVALASKNYRDIEVVVDESKEKPTVVLKWESPALERDRVELSSDSLEEAEACLPPVRGEGPA